MAALSGPRATVETDAINRVLPVAAGVKCFQGALAVMVAGFVKPGLVSNAAVAVGRFEGTVDNSAGGNGAATARVKRGCFKWANAGTDPVPAANVGKNCYVLDDQTVAATDGGGGARSIAGLVHQVDADGVWVRTPNGARHATHSFPRRPLSMIINQANLDLLTTGFKASFKEGLGGVTPMWDKFATLIPSSTAAELYAWLGSFPMMREWIGDRVRQNIRDNTYTLRNKDFESTVDVPRNAIEDDQYGIYSPMMKAMGEAAGLYPDEQIFATLQANPLCFDGQNFFDTDHPVGQPGFQQTVSNVQAGGTAWYVMDTTKVLKPFLNQQRKTPEFVVKTDPRTSDRVFERKEFTFGVDARMAGGVSFWQLAYMSQATLNADNIKAAITALQSLKSDEGRPLNIRPNLLVLGAGNWFAGRALMTQEFIAATSNDVKGVLEPVYVPYLP